MDEYLTLCIFYCGIAQLCILCASALVPLQLDWKRAFQPLPKLLRQMYWVYGGYIVLSIIAFGTMSIICAEEIASGTGLARALSAYIAIFWGLRIGLQCVFDVKEHLTKWWLKCGYHFLSVVFLCLTLVYAWAACG